MRHRALGLVLVLASLPLAAAAQEVPLPSWVRSGEVNDDGVVVYVAPDEKAQRRATVALGTRLPVLGRVRGAGCGDFRFVQVGEEAFVCEQKLTWSPSAPSGVAQPPMAAGALLPHQYLFVVSDGSVGYARPSDYEADDFAVVFGQDFGLVAAERTVYGGLPFVRSAHGYYVLEESLAPRTPSDFAGVMLRDGKLDGVEWLVPRAPRGPRRARTKATRVHPPLVAAPADVAPSERWAYVDTETQTLVVYEGARPILATLVSTGLPGDATETPKGDFRIWAKLATSDMNDTERQDVEHNYSIEAVPWVMFFHESIAMHAAFWHDGFGERRSHGCVNLSPRDARTVFGLLGPALPDGYTAILTTPKQPGARVIVR